MKTETTKRPSEVIRFLVVLIIILGSAFCMTLGLTVGMRYNSAHYPMSKKEKAYGDYRMCIQRCGDPK